MGRRLRKGQALASVERSQRRRAFHLARIEAQQDPMDRASALNDYFRRMLALVSPSTADRAVASVRSATLAAIEDIERSEELR